jgi:lysozyme family protein
MLAASLLPEITKTLVAEKDRAAAAAVAEAVSKAVTDVAGTSDPAAASEKLAADPAVAADLRLKLARIAADREAQRRQAETDALKARLDAEAQDRAQQMEALKAQLADRASARSSFESLATTGSWGGLGAPLVSAVVTIGFFVLVLLLIVSPAMQQMRDGPVLQLLHVMFGTFATGFATVISFWLGSSQGSRNKDATSFALQTQQAEQTGEILKYSAAQAGEPGRGKVSASSATSQQPASQTSNFKACLDLVLVQEGGFVDNPRDPGGATNLGITQRTLAQWRGEQVSVDDVKALTRQEAAEIYRAQYWNVLHCDALPPGVDLVTFDMGVNAGPARSARMLQKAVGAAQDGAIGPATLAATRAADPADVIRSITASRMAYYQSLPTWADFGRGWTRRSNDIESAALAMAQKAATRAAA